ncbi:hypothetical protein [Streptomonospora salina]|uniref:Uncharacterized protein n=1 Tax=Streptomonospora salina TaxID=104205 RepID=A0A841EAQ3_9ACTN|nr:hypothetical protein [Streptomonospora salina]MBB6000205.1 hypothetical protein [Streptomonospora salina]
MIGARAELNDLLDQAAEMGEYVLECRDVGHIWKDWTVARLRHGFEQTMRCSQCGTERVRFIDPEGYIDSSHYRYPDGYLVHGLGRLTVDHRAALRLELLQRSA